MCLIRQNILIGIENKGVIRGKAVISIKMWLINSEIDCLELDATSQTGRFRSQSKNSPDLR